MATKTVKAIVLLLGIAAIFGAACKKEPDNQGCCKVPSDTANVLVVCEGSLGNGNAALSVYSKNKDSIYTDAYFAANGQTLGDVFQSVTRIGNEYFLCVNNSDKIVVVDCRSFLLRHTISIAKPRYMLPFGDGLAYVSSLFSNKLYLVNTAAYSVVKSIDMPRLNPERMLLSGNQAWICCWDTACDKVYKVDIRSHQLIDSVPVGGRAPQEILADKDGMLWVLSGNVAKGKSSALTKIDPVTHSIAKVYSFPAGTEPIKPVFNGTMDTLYFIEVKYNGGSEHNGIFRMRHDDASLPGQALVSCGAYQYFWALGIDPSTGYIYVGDPKGFIQKGNVMVYKQDGTLINQFAVSVGPGNFYFD